MKKGELHGAALFLRAVHMEMENGIRQTEEKYIILFREYLRKDEKYKWEKPKKYFQT